jgi:type VI secretion system protein ImpA
LRDIGIAKREISPSADPSRPPAEMAVIDAAFGDTNTEDLTAQAQAAKDCMADVDAIEAFLTDKVGASKSIALDGLRESLREVLACVEGYLVKRGAISQASVASPGAAQGSSPPPLPASAIGVASGEFRSTQDILAALDRMCQYYERNEPSSPVPLVLTSAKRLVAKNFVEIMRQIPPDALRVLESLGGVAGPSETP